MKNQLNVQLPIKNEGMPEGCSYILMSEKFDENNQENDKYTIYLRHDRGILSAFWFDNDQNRFLPHPILEEHLDAILNLQSKLKEGIYSTNSCFSEIISRCGYTPESHSKFKKAEKLFFQISDARQELFKTNGEKATSEKLLKDFIFLFNLRMQKCLLDLDKGTKSAGVNPRDYVLLLAKKAFNNKKPVIGLEKILNEKINFMEKNNYLPLDFEYFTRVNSRKIPPSLKVSPDQFNRIFRNKQSATKDIQMPSLQIEKVEKEMVRKFYPAYLQRPLKQPVAALPQETSINPDESKTANSLTDNKDVALETKTSLSTTNMVIAFEPKRCDNMQFTQEESDQIHWNSLPNNVKIKILLYLSYGDWLKCKMVSKDMCIVESKMNFNEAIDDKNSYYVPMTAALAVISGSSAFVYATQGNGFYLSFSIITGISAFCNAGYSFWACKRQRDKKYSNEQTPQLREDFKNKLNENELESYKKK